MKFYASFVLKNHLISFALFLSFNCYFSFAQDSLSSIKRVNNILPVDENGYTVYPHNKKRIKLVAAANIITYTGIMAGLNAAWYARYPRSSFHFFNDNAEWLQVDKAGHVFGAYIGSRYSNDMWRWAGMPRNKRIWVSGLSGVAYETIIETLDGFSSEYGWSWGDFSSNILGSAIFLSQELAWDDQRIRLKFSFHKKNYGQDDLNARASNIFGKTEAERFIKDYNGTTVWVSANIKSLLPQSKMPRWMTVAFGYGAEGMFGARSNVAVDKNGMVIFDRSDIERYRQWYISPDIDLTKIKTNKRGLRFLFVVLSALKFPAPTLEFSKGKVKGHWVHF